MLPKIPLLILVNKRSVVIHSLSKNFNGFLRHEELIYEVHVRI
jgi:hypothetical protein